MGRVCPNDPRILVREEQTIAGLLRDKAEHVVLNPRRALPPNQDDRCNQCTGKKDRTEINDVKHGAPQLAGASAIPKKCKPRIEKLTATLA